MRRVIFLCLFTLLGIQAMQAQKKVFVMEIRAEVDPRMNRYVKLALEEADKINADYVVIDMDTYGGALNDADDIRKRVLDYEKPVFVFINKNAASAGALISIACDKIYMSDGASIGAATVVLSSDGSKAPDKYQSYMRAEMRSTAEAKGRDPQIAEAMVDQDLEVEGVSEKGQVITFTPSEAMKHGFCEGNLNSIEEVLQENDIINPEMIYYESSTAENIIAWFLNPAISGVLILIIVGGIYFELQTPGVGFPIAAACIAAILYFVPYYLNGLAANWEVLVFFAGIVLLALEVFVIPGFGVAGIAGIMLLVGSLGLMMLDNDFFDFSRIEDATITEASLITMLSFIGAGVLIFVGLANLRHFKIYDKIALQDTLDTQDGYTSNFNQQNMVGMKGEAYTVLRPSGKIMIDDEIYDAFTRGSFIDKGDEVEVISQEGTSLKVKKAKK